MPGDTDILREIHKRSHEDEMRYRLVMQHLRQLRDEKGNKGLLKRLKKQWEANKRSEQTNID